MNEYGGAPQSTPYFQITEGANKVRVLSEGAIIASHWVDNQFHTCFGKSNGCPHSHEKSDISIKFLHWVIDRKDETTKLARFPYTVEKKIGALSADEDWAFDGFPMPYDVNITAIGAGTKEVDYNVIASPKQIKLSDAEQTDYEAQTPVGDIVERMKDKEMKRANPKVEDLPVKEEEPIDPDAMPF